MGRQSGFLPGPWAKRGLGSRVVGHLFPRCGFWPRSICCPQRCGWKQNSRKTSPGWPPGCTRSHIRGSWEDCGARGRTRRPATRSPTCLHSTPGQEPGSGPCTPAPPSQSPATLPPTVSCLLPPSALVEASLLSQDMSSPDSSSESTELATHSPSSPCPQAPWGP